MRATGPDDDERDVRQAVDAARPRCSSADWLELWYQPKIDLQTSDLIGAEGAGARAPSRARRAPAGRVPARRRRAEMHALTERVIITALRDWNDCAAARHAGDQSRRQRAGHPRLVELPIAQMHPRGAAARRTNWPGLILEVTEDQIIHDLKLANEVADELREHRCSLAIDDFGAGYSSLARLRQLPFSELKIDRSLRRPIAIATRSMPACARPSSSSASGFGLKTVAEGIETHPREPQAAGPRLRRRPGLSCSPSRCRRPISSADLRTRHDGSRSRARGATGAGSRSTSADPDRPAPSRRTVTCHVTRCDLPYGSCPAIRREQDRHARHSSPRLGNARAPRHPRASVLQPPRLARRAAPAALR